MAEFPHAVSPRMPSTMKVRGGDFPVTFDADGVRTIHNCDFINDPRFVEAYRLGMATGHSFGSDLHIEWRVYVCCWAASQAKRIGGDFVECGVNTGIYSRALMHYIDFASMPDRRFYLLDTFNGIPLEQLTESERESGREGYNRMYPDCYETVLRTFAAFPNARIVRGKIPDTLAAIDSGRISYASIDLNCVMPEIAAGEYLWPRLASGAIMVLDDYGWGPHVNQKTAWDRFAADRGAAILSMPTGQGLLIKA